MSRSIPRHAKFISRRRALRRGRRVAVRLTVTGRDAAGNRARVVRRAVLRG